MKWLNRISSLLLMVFCVLIITSSLKLGIGDFRNPGPGFMGFLASILLFLLILIILIKESTKLAKEKGKEHFGWENVSKQFIITVALCGYALFLDTLGFLLSSFILMWIMLLISSPRKWFTQMVVAFIVVNVSYLVLCKWLRVLLPAGILRLQW